MLSNLIRLTLILLFFGFGKVLGQQLPSENYTTADGLPNNAIRALHLDSRGILWIGTENGISKLENGSFENFFERDGLAFNSCWAIAEDKNHHLWFGSYGGGVTFFDGKNFQKIQMKDGLADDRIRRFYPYENYMLVGTEDGVSMIDIESFEITTLPESTNNTDLNYTTGFWKAEGRLFYSTYRSGSYEIIWNETDSQIQKINDWLPIYGVFQEGEKLLLADKGSLKTITQKDFESGKSPTHSQSSSIFWQKTEGLNGESYLLAAGLFTKDGGIFQWKEGKLISLNERFNIDSKFIQAAALDAEKGLLYLGSQDKGIYQVRVDENLIYERFGDKEVKDISGRKGLLGLLHSQGLEIRDSANSEVFQVDRTAFKTVQDNYYRQNPEKIPDQMDGFFELDPTILAEDLEFYELHFRDSFFWINNNLGVFKLSEKGEILTYLPIHCFSMGFTPDGKLMETNPYAGVRIYDDPDQFSFTYFHPDEENTPLQIAKVVSDEKNTYLASVFHGFYQWDGERFISYLKEGIWEEQKFKSLHRLASGHLLVGTEFGDLFEITPYPNFKIINHWENEALQGTSILRIESYEKAIIVVTERGIHVLEGDKNSFFDQEQGFYQKLFLSAKRLGDQLYLGTSRGFYQVNLPEFVQNRSQEIQLGITEIKVNHDKLSSKEYDWFVFQPKNLALESDQNTLFIRFKPTGNLNTEKLRFRYRLKSTADWTEFFNDPVIELPYLPWGIMSLR
ncbi:two-component regulator propeller domain-containing protein [Algoriphagus hitonicola]|uniref:two-component regulator propeller domain-containing protein n=1 Tax=Algoriphagus hitonicola TaxID=435880 RepID=UPI003622663F